MNDPIQYIYDALNSSDLKNKDDLMSEVRTCATLFISYYRVVVEGKLYYSCTPEEHQKTYIMTVIDKRRRLAHDQCISACLRLNEICSELGLEKICDFDIEDRIQAAQFCGYIVSTLYFSDIKCDKELSDWLGAYPLIDERFL